MKDATGRNVRPASVSCEFGSGLSAHALSSEAVRTVHRTQETSSRYVPGTEDFTWTVEGSGGELVVAQARAAGVEYVFANPGSFESGLYDALTDVETMHVILGLREMFPQSAADPERFRAALHYKAPQVCYEQLDYVKMFFY